MTALPISPADVTLYIGPMCWCSVPCDHDCVISLSSKDGRASIKRSVCLDGVEINRLIQAIAKERIFFLFEKRGGETPRGPFEKAWKKKPFDSVCGDLRSHFDEYGKYPCRGIVKLLYSRLRSHFDEYGKYPGCNEVLAKQILTRIFASDGIKRSVSCWW